MKSLACIASLIALASVAGGCAVITDGTTQTITVESKPQAGAACEAGNGRGTWHLPATPGTITVAKAYADLTVSCKHADGSIGSRTVASETKGAVVGSALLFGGIGLAADIASGAAYEYPKTVSVDLAMPGATPVAGASTPPPTETAAAPADASKTK